MRGRFCSLDQTHSECERTLVEIMSYRNRNQVKTKKKVFTFLVFRKVRQFRIKFGRNLLDLFALTGPFSSYQPALKSRWGTLNLDGVTLNLDGGTLTFDGETPPTASPLQFKYCIYVYIFLLFLVFITCLGVVLNVF